MTATQLIWLLFFGMLVNFAGMRYFWNRSEEAEKENKWLKSEIERKDRMLGEWEKYAPFLAAHGAFEVKEADHEPTD